MELEARDFIIAHKTYEKPPLFPTYFAYNGGTKPATHEVDPTRMCTLVWLACHAPNCVPRPLTHTQRYLTQLKAPWPPCGWRMTPLLGPSLVPCTPTLAPGSLTVPPFSLLLYKRVGVVAMASPVTKAHAVPPPSDTGGRCPLDPLCL